MLKNRPDDFRGFRTLKIFCLKKIDVALFFGPFLYVFSIKHTVFIYLLSTGVGRLLWAQFLRGVLPAGVVGPSGGTVPGPGVPAADQRRLVGAQQNVAGRGAEVHAGRRRRVISDGCSSSNTAHHHHLIAARPAAAAADGKHGA